MGKPMAKNLIQAGHELTVNDMNKENIAMLVNEGAKTAASGAELARNNDIIITMLPNSPNVKEVVCGVNGILSAAKEGLVLIDMSSIAPLASQEISRECAIKGVRMLEAPVSGGEPKAIDGTLSIMCGGDQKLFEECVPVLNCMGSDIVYCGEAGAGNTTKLANQVIVAVNIAAVSEAFMLAKRAGVDPNKVYEAIKGGLAGSTVMNAKGTMMLANNTQPGFKIDLHIKDLNNAIETAHATGAPIPLSVMVMEMLQNLHKDGLGQSDHSAIAKFYEKMAGDTIY
ncbi:MAG: 2-hydroxy-3-oxopropionate reductase [Herbinix sp.]|nr:2-hydroxy-3-oxopropionate reductase [Herbinix sp.]